MVKKFGVKSRHFKVSKSASQKNLFVIVNTDNKIDMSFYGTAEECGIMFGKWIKNTLEQINNYNCTCINIITNWE